MFEGYVFWHTGLSKLARIKGSCSVDGSYLLVLFFKSGGVTWFYLSILDSVMDDYHNIGSRVLWLCRFMYQ
jgi:hypothetical protein